MATTFFTHTIAITPGNKPDNPRRPDLRIFLPEFLLRLLVRNESRTVNIAAVDPVFVFDLPAPAAIHRLAGGVRLDDHVFRVFDDPSRPPPRGRKTRSGHSSRTAPPAPCPKARTQNRRRPDIDRPFPAGPIPAAKPPRPLRSAPPPSLCRPGWSRPAPPHIPPESGRISRSQNDRRGLVHERIALGVPFKNPVL